MPLLLCTGGKGGVIPLCQGIQSPHSEVTLQFFHTDRGVFDTEMCAGLLCSGTKITELDVRLVLSLPLFQQQLKTFQFYLGLTFVALVYLFCRLLVTPLCFFFSWCCIV